jgi:hypothetical protein
MSITSLGAGLSGLYARQQALDADATGAADPNAASLAARKALLSDADPDGSGVKLSAEGRNLAATQADAEPAEGGSSTLLYQAGLAMSAQVVNMAYQRMGTLINVSA